MDKKAFDARPSERIRDIASKIPRSDESLRRQVEISFGDYVAAKQELKKKKTKKIALWGARTPDIPLKRRTL